MCNSPPRLFSLIGVNRSSDVLFNSRSGLSGAKGGNPGNPGNPKPAKLINRSNPPRFRLEASNCFKKSIGLPVPRSRCKLSNLEAAAAAAAAAAALGCEFSWFKLWFLAWCELLSPVLLGGGGDPSVSNLDKSVSTNLNLSRPLAAAMLRACKTKKKRQFVEPRPQLGARTVSLIDKCDNWQCKCLSKCLLKSISATCHQSHFSIFRKPFLNYFFNFAYFVFFAKNL